MPLLDAYADAAAYRAALKGTDAGDDTAILDRLTAISRLIDDETGGKPGRFNQVDAETRYFDGNGLAIMDFDEFRVATTIKVDTVIDGVYDQTVDGSNRQDMPFNADKFSEPFRKIRLVPFAANTELGLWTKGLRTVEILGDWGWPAVPTLVRDLCIGLGHDLWDLLRSGATLSLQQIDVGFRLSPETNNLLKRARRVYGPAVVIV